MAVSILGKILRGRGAERPAMAAQEAPVLVNAYVTLRESPPLDFPHRLLNRRDRSDPELIPHLQGFVGYVMTRGDGAMTAGRYHLWRHLQRVRHQLSFDVPGTALDGLAGWADRANAVLILPDGSVRAPDLAVLLGADGSADPAAALPYPSDAFARRDRSMQRLSHIRPLPARSLPPSLGEGEVELRSAPGVIDRAYGLLAVATRGRSVAMGTGEEVAGLTAAADAAEALTPKELAFVEADAPDGQHAMEMSWRFEALNVLLWALGSDAGHLDRWDEVADTDALARGVRALGGPDRASTATLRPAAEILDALDLTWRQHWSVRQARVEELDLAGLDPDVVVERHVALNWLTGFHNDPGTEWDEIDTPS